MKKYYSRFRNKYKKVWLERSELNWDFDNMRMNYAWFCNEDNRNRLYYSI